MPKPFNLKRLLAHGPELIEAERVFIRKIPCQLGLTVLYVVVASIWCVFSNEMVENIMGTSPRSPALETLEGVNFVFATGLVLYLVLRRNFRTRRLAEEAQRLSQQRFESVALAATDAIWDLNLETKVISWSDGMHKLFQLRAAKSPRGWIGGWIGSIRKIRIGCWNPSGS